MQFKGFFEFSFLVENLYFFVLHLIHSRHFTPYSLYIGSVNTVFKASHQLQRGEYFYEISLQEDSDDENKSFLFFLF